MFDGGNSPGPLGLPGGKNSATSKKSVEAVERGTLTPTSLGQRNILVKEKGKTAINKFEIGSRSARSTR